MKLQKNMIVVLLTCFLTTLTFVHVNGQTADDISSLRSFIERNHELLQQARALVHETSSIKAREALRMAEKLHRESVNQLDAGRFLFAGRLAKQAREAILQTIALAKREAKLEESAQRAIERAAHRLEQARQLIEETQSQALPPRRLVEEAHGLLGRAMANQREHLFEIALKLAVNSEELSMRAINLLKQDAANPEMIAREIEKTDEILERAGQRMQQVTDPAIRRLFQEAVELQQRAKDNYQRGRYRAALDMTRKARNIAMRAIKLVTSAGNPENVEQALQLTDMLIEEAEEIASERDSDRLRNQIARAKDIQSKAKDHFERGHFERALRMTLRARGILKDALGQIKEVLDKTRVENALQETDDILRRLDNALSEADEADETANDLFARATAQQDKAWKSFRSDELRAALAHTKLARNLARRAFRALNHEDI